MSKIVLIADSHIIMGTPQEADFFRMLSVISETNYDVMFLGDNLDIWIASASKYESDTHRHFLQWCKQEKERREIILIEGNHEFYVCRHHKDAFSHCTETVYRNAGIAFVHGDITHAQWGFHRCFRFLAKNSFGDFLMRHFPGGVLFSKKMKQLLSHEHRCKKNETNDFIPYNLVDKWVDNEHKIFGTDWVILGHFHQGANRTLESGVRYQIIPAWKNHEDIAIVDTKTRQIILGQWNELLC